MAPLAGPCLGFLGPVGFRGAGGLPWPVMPAARLRVQLVAELGLAKLPFSPALARLSLRPRRTLQPPMIDTSRMRITGPPGGVASSPSRTSLPPSSDPAGASRPLAHREPRARRGLYRAAARQRTHAHVVGQQLELLAGAHRVGGLESLFELLDAQPTLGRRVAEGSRRRARAQRPRRAGPATPAPSMGARESAVPPCSGRVLAGLSLGRLEQLLGVVALAATDRFPRRDRRRAGCGWRRARRADSLARLARRFGWGARRDAGALLSGRHAALPAEPHGAKRMSITDPGALRLALAGIGVVGTAPDCHTAPAPLP